MKRKNLNLFHEELDCDNKSIGTYRNWNSYYKDYYYKNREAILKQKKDYYHKNKDKKRAYQNTYKTKNLDRVRERARTNGRKRYAINKEKILARQRLRNQRPDIKLKLKQIQQEYNRTYPEKRKAYSVKKKYGLTIEQYKKILLDQNYQCKICRKDISEIKNQAIDHCHRTRKVRAILCRICNSTLGLFREDQSILRRAISYLAEHNGLDLGALFSSKPLTELLALEGCLTERIEKSKEPILALEYEREVIKKVINQKVNEYNEVDANELR